MQLPPRLVLDRWLLGGCLLVAVLLVAMALNLETTRRQQDNQRVVAHTHEVIDAIDDARNRVRDLELLDRVYLVSGRPEDLERVGPAAAIAQSAGRWVEALTRDDPRQQARIPELLRTLDELERFYRAAAEARRLRGAGAARETMLQGEGVQLLEHLNSLLAVMEGEERQKLYDRAESSERAYRAALATGLLTGLASMALLVGFVLLLRRHLVRTSQDADELRALTRELELASRRKDRFLATLAHELRNPLAPVRTATGILGSPHLDAERLAWCRTVIARQVGQMAAVLDDLLDVTRISRGKLKLRHETVPLAGIVDVAIEAARPVIERKQHALELRLPAQLPMVEVDAARLGQALTNLLTNAAKYTDPNGRIVLSAEVRERDMVLQVRDSGIGIAPERLGEAFDMFTQVDEDDSRGEGGLGIGLALTRGVVQLHGGTIAADSEGLGRGSTFTIVLLRAVVPGAALAPAPAPPEAAAAAPEGQAASAAQGLGHRVLVVDDNRDGGCALGMMLEMAGHTVHVVAGAEEALQDLQAFGPDVAFVDTGMREVEADALARDLRMALAGREIALVAVGGWGAQGTAAVDPGAGFDAHVTKPADPDAIAALLAQPVHALVRARQGEPDAEVRGG